MAKTKKCATKIIADNHQIVTCQLVIPDTDPGCTNHSVANSTLLLYDKLGYRILR